jgi:type VI protein secretion system component VasK
VKEAGPEEDEPDTVPTEEPETESDPMPESSKASRRLAIATLVLAVVSALLLIGAGTMTGLYLHERSATDRVSKERAAARQLAQDRNNKLLAARQQASELDAKRLELEAKALDPQGYELIKQCVQGQAALERAFAKVVEQHASPDSSGALSWGEWVGPVDGVPINPSGSAGVSYRSIFSGCAEAEKYLK